MCRPGFIGNGRDCRMICALNEVFNGVSCVKLATVEEGKKNQKCFNLICELFKDSNLEFDRNFSVSLSLIISN